MNSNEHSTTQEEAMHALSLAIKNFNDALRDAKEMESPAFPALMNDYEQQVITSYRKAFTQACFAVSKIADVVREQSSIFDELESKVIASAFDQCDVYDAYNVYMSNSPAIAKALFFHQIKNQLADFHVDTFTAGETSTTDFDCLKWSESLMQSIIAVSHAMRIWFSLCSMFIELATTLGYEINIANEMMDELKRQSRAYVYDLRHSAWEMSHAEPN
jgi:hypothetical protein